MKISARIENSLNKHNILVETDGSAKAVHITPKVSGYGSSVNGGELLLLALATCYCNDIYREAARQKISVSGVQVEVQADFAAEGESGSNFRYKTKITSAEPEHVIEALIRHTDQVAEIHNTLRKGVNVELEYEFKS